MRRRVFCASMSDVFDNQADPRDRADLFALIDATPNLDWLLLTKRPQNIAKMLPRRQDRIFYGASQAFQQMPGNHHHPLPADLARDAAARPG